LPFGWNRQTDFRVPEAPKVAAQPKMSVHQSLESGPKTFRDLMEAAGSRDGRDVLIELDAVRNAVGLDRTPDGRYRLASPK